MRGGHQSFKVDYFYDSRYLYTYIHVSFLYKQTNNYRNLSRKNLSVLNPNTKTYLQILLYFV